MKINDEDVLPYFRPVIREHFGAEFAHAAGTPGAPKRPEDVTGIVTRKNENIFSGLIQDANDCYMAGGHAMVTSLAVTHPGLLDVFDAMSVTLILQKFSPSAGITARYNKLFSLFPRSAFTGNILSHLVRRDGQQDYGLMDGVRLVGNYYGNNVMRVNEKRPLVHPKPIVFLYPDKAGQLEPRISWDGSANATENGEFSFEEMNRSEDPKFVMANYLSVCHYYSLSEGLYNFSGGMVPTYWWEKKAVKYSAPPKCPACKNKSMAVRWLRTEDHPREHRKYLFCTDPSCNERLPYLTEHTICP